MFTPRGLATIAGLGLTIWLPRASPARAQEIFWQRDYNTARRTAREKNRPLVIDFGTTHCTWCRKLETTTFRDPAVVKTLGERFVTVKLDGEEEAHLAASLGISSFPTLVFASPEGKILGYHDGFVDAVRFQKQLERALSESGQAVVRPPLSSPSTVEVANGRKNEDNGRGVLRLTVPSSTTKLSPENENRFARDLLARAKEDFQAQQDLHCLNHCKELTEKYPERPEAGEARRLVAQIKANPERVRQVSENLENLLGELYLERADVAWRDHQVQKAASYLEQILAACPDTRYAPTARERLQKLRDQLAMQATPPTTVRGQGP